MINSVVCLKRRRYRFKGGFLDEQLDRPDYSTVICFRHSIGMLSSLISRPSRPATPGRARSPAAPCGRALAGSACALIDGVARRWGVQFADSTIGIRTVGNSIQAAQVHAAIAESSAPAECRQQNRGAERRGQCSGPARVW